MPEIQGNKITVPVEITNAIFRTVTKKDGSEVLVADMYVQAHNGDVAEVTVWLSDDLVERGNDAGRKQIDVSVELLEANGMTNGSPENIENCLGKKTTIYVTERDDGDFRYYLNTPPKSIAPSEVAKKIAAMRGEKNMPAPVDEPDDEPDDDDNLPF